MIQLAELFEGGHADVDRVAQGAGLGAGLGHAHQVLGDGGADVRAARVADAAEDLAALQLDLRRHHGQMPVLGGRQLHQLGADRFQAPLVGLVEQALVGDELLPLQVDDVPPFHGGTSFARDGNRSSGDVMGDNSVTMPILPGFSNIYSIVDDEDPAEKWAGFPKAIPPASTTLGPIAPREGRRLPCGCAGPWSP
ncbi:hypothetical protein D3C86_1448420 [compost metagenome]